MILVMVVINGFVFPNADSGGYSVQLKIGSLISSFLTNSIKTIEESPETKITKLGSVLLNLLRVSLIEKIKKVTKRNKGSTIVGAEKTKTVSCR